MGGADCELVGCGLLAQPANAWSSVAYVVAGVWLLARTSPRASAGWALVAVGVGSIAYHGPRPGWAGAAHDVSIAVLLALPVARRWWVVVVATVAVAALPGAASAIHGAIAVASAWTALRRGWVPPASLALGAVAAVLYVVGRTGGPLCDPTSVLQPHAGWHVLTAIAAAAVARRRQGRI